MNFEELFANGIYEFGGKPLPIDCEKTLEMIYKKDALEPFIKLYSFYSHETNTFKPPFFSPHCGEKNNEENKIMFGFICYTCGFFNAIKIYKHLVSLEKDNVNIKLDFYSGLIKYLAVSSSQCNGCSSSECILVQCNEENKKLIIEKIIRFATKKKTKHLRRLRRIRIMTFLFDNKNYDILERLAPIMKPEEIATALTDALSADTSVYEFAIKYVRPSLLLNITIYGAYERSVECYKDKIKFLKDKIDPPAAEPINQECFKLLGVTLNYF